MALKFEENGLLLGKVISVDTASVIVKVDDEDVLSNIQVNRLVSLHSGLSERFLVGIIQKITRKSEETTSLTDEELSKEISPLDVVKIALIGTYYDTLGGKPNVFRRSLESVPKIGACCFKIEGDLLTQFMQIISDVNDENKSHLTLGTYTIDNDAVAYLNGNKLFQRHAVIVGSTGSGKSWTTATIIQQTATLQNGNAILFDIHNEYKPLQKEGICHFKIAGPNDIASKNGLDKGVIYLPFWLLGYEDIISMLVDRSDNNAPNQAMMINKLINEEKENYLKQQNKTDILENFTIDSPIPFSLKSVIDRLKYYDNERVEGARAGTDKAGDFNGKFTRLIARIEAKATDRRFGFMFGSRPLKNPKPSYCN